MTSCKEWEARLASDFIDLPTRDQQLGANVLLQFSMRKWFSGISLSFGLNAATHVAVSCVGEMNLPCMVARNVRSIFFLSPTWLASIHGVSQAITELYICMVHNRPFRSILCSVGPWYPKVMPSKFSYSWSSQSFAGRPCLGRGSLPKFWCQLSCGC